MNIGEIFIVAYIGSITGTIMTIVAFYLKDKDE